MKSPFSIIKSRYNTEKSRVLSSLHQANSNASVRKCDTPKAVFLVDKKANKKEIAWAIEEIYAEKKIKVLSVNTINVKPKQKRVRGRVGKTNAFKKAVVTMAPGCSIEDQQV
jgi:large subunit ribosomal protein L23